MRSSFPLAASVLVLFPLLGACGSDAGVGDGPRFSVTDSAGIELAVTRFSGVIPAAGLTIDTTRKVVYGESGPDSVQLIWLRDATRMADGRVVAIDRRAREFLVFSPAGVLTARGGRPGDGPGEFQRPAGVVTLPGDTIAVYDGSHMRFSLFDVAGNFLADRRLEQPGRGDGSPRLFMYGLADAVGDTLVLRGEGWSMLDDETEGYIWENPTLRYTSDGRLVDEVAEPMKMWFYGTPEGPEDRLFGGLQNVDAEAGRVVVADRERYEVRVYRPGRGLVRIARLTRPRRPVTDEVLGAYKDQIYAQVENPDSRIVIMAAIDRSPVADSMSWIDELLVDRLGGVWVFEQPFPGDEPAIGVFSPAGEWLGAVERPANFEPLEIGADYVLGLLTDELEVQHLVMYGLERRR